MLRNNVPSPSRATSESAVATSRRALRLSWLIPITPSPENIMRPKNWLTPSRLAAAAPGNVPSGRACAAKEEPLITTKKPTKPATTAMMVATIQLLTIKLENISALHRFSGPAVRRKARFPVRAIPDMDRDDVGQKNNGDDEEAHRPAMAGRPVKTVIGKEKATPGGTQTDERGENYLP